jgi:hypothetical protein
MPTTTPTRTPSQLFRLFARGQISREEFHAAMAEHAGLLIAEMEEEHRNPVAAYFERMRNRRLAARLVRRHGEAAIRAAFAALAETPDFPPARFLWNAWHWDVPLHCFLRSGREPVFRVLRFASKRMSAELVVEYGAPHDRRTTREGFTLNRDEHGKLTVRERRKIG